MTTAGRRIVVVVPVFNEAEALPRFHERLMAVLVEVGRPAQVIYVDDGSADESFEILRRLAHEDRRIAVVRLARNFGHQIALTAGLDHADGDAVITLDADLEMPPEAIPEFLARWDEGAKVVQGRRRTRDVVGWTKRVTSQAFYAVINRLSEVPIEPDAPDYRLLDRSALDVLRRMRERNRFLRGMVALLGMRRAIVEYQPGPRVAGRSKYSTVRMVGLALDAVISFSTVPLRLSIAAGFLAATLGGGYGLYVVWARLFRADAVPGWASTTVAVLLLGGAILVVLGIIGEYVARIYAEAKGRPLYVVQDRVGRVAAEL